MRFCTYVQGCNASIAHARIREKKSHGLPTIASLYGKEKASNHQENAALVFSTSSHGHKVSCVQARPKRKDIWPSEGMAIQKSEYYVQLHEREPYPSH